MPKIIHEQHINDHSSNVAGSQAEIVFASIKAGLNSILNTGQGVFVNYPAEW